MPQAKPFDIYDKHRCMFVLQNLRTNCETMMEYLKEIPVKTPCDACTFFELEKTHCKKWDAPVPAAGRPAGCENFFFKEGSAPF